MAGTNMKKKATSSTSTSISTSLPSTPKSSKTSNSKVSKSTTKISKISTSTFNEKTPSSELKMKKGSKGLTLGEQLAQLQNSAPIGLFHIFILFQIIQLEINFNFNFNFKLRI